MTYNDYIKRIGIEIRVARLRQGVTGKILAQKVGISERNLNDLELGKCGGRIETYWRICAAMDIDMKILLP